MITVIGICSGEILAFLENHKNNASIGILFENIDSSYVVILMTLGWLAREGYVRIDGVDYFGKSGANLLKANISLKKISGITNK